MSAKRTKKEIEFEAEVSLWPEFNGTPMPQDVLDLLAKRLLRGKAERVKSADMDALVKAWATLPRPNGQKRETLADDLGWSRAKFFQVLKACRAKKLIP